MANDRQSRSQKKKGSDKTIPEHVLDSIDNGKEPYAVANLIADEKGRKAGRIANLTANLYHKTDLDREAVKHAVPKLVEYATKIHEIDVKDCNETSDPKRSARRKSLVQQLQTLAQEELGARMVVVQGDPRGFPVSLFFEQQLGRLIKNNEHYTPTDEGKKAQRERELNALKALRNDKGLTDDQQKLLYRLFDRNRSKGIEVPNTNEV